MNTSSNGRMSGRVAAKILGHILRKISGDLAQNEGNFAQNQRTQPPIFKDSLPIERAVNELLEKVRKHSSCSPECFVLAMIYIKRILFKTNLRLTPLNVSIIALTSILLAVKFHDDLFYNNRFFAYIGDVSLAELNSMEAKFLSIMGFDLFVSPEQFGEMERFFQCQVQACVRSTRRVASGKSTQHFKSSSSCTKQGEMSQSRLAMILKNSAFGNGFRTWNHSLVPIRCGASRKAENASRPSNGHSFVSSVSSPCIKVDNEAFYAFANLSLKYRTAARTK
mmetsp:Transcript_1519/g.2021  ORF Transcript_1519/g.2021 Transcript_1519/m.2021 type:complete len:280 (+) Transcript_1519:180-1019(+)